MRTGKELIGLAIVDVRDGKKLGHADEIVISPDDGRLLGFVMKGGGLFSSKESIVEIGDVRSIGRDAITVEGDEVAHTPGPPRRPSATRAAATARWSDARS